MFPFVSSIVVFKVKNLCISSMCIALLLLLLHGFVPVETRLLKACGTDFYEIILVNTFLQIKCRTLDKSVLLKKINFLLLSQNVLWVLKPSQYYSSV